MKLSRSALIAAACCILGGPAAAQQRDYTQETQAQRDARMGWWRDARFGLFIHWGAYAVPAGSYHGERVGSVGEWIMERAKIPISEYESYPRQFNPTRFDAEQWVRIAKDAGMKYIVITSKHHDGFALFDSNVSKYDLRDATPFHRDALKELAAAARREGIKLGFYYSIMDWHHPDAQAPNFPTYNSSTKTNPEFDRYVEEYMKPQIRQLLTEYGDIGVMWFDGEWIPDWTEERGRDLYNFVRSIRPDVLVNNRVGKGRQGMKGLTTAGHVGDFGTPEQEVPPEGLPGIDWESCMTMNDTWGYKSFDDNWKDSQTLLRTLVDVASKGGNLLLNVGPTATGEIPGESVSRLQEMGRWLRVNGKSIYGTTASPFSTRPAWGRYTRRNATLYAHVFAWPKDNRLLLSGVTATPTRAYLLADRKPLRMENTAAGIVVHLPGTPPSRIDAVLALEGMGALRNP